MQQQRQPAVHVPGIALVGEQPRLAHPQPVAIVAVAPSSDTRAGQPIRLIIGVADARLIRVILPNAIPLGIIRISPTDPGAADRFTQGGQFIGCIIEACGDGGRAPVEAVGRLSDLGRPVITPGLAAQRLATPVAVRHVQFHPAFSYEQFIEGMQIAPSGATVVTPGVFLKWNQLASQDPTHAYVLLIEELTRAEVAAVLGEVLTYIEYRDQPFHPAYSQQPTRIAKNLVILATYNPNDRSAINLDDALLRRMRIISCPPSPEQLAELLKPRDLPESVIYRLQEIFTACATQFGPDYVQSMPFGHAIFADIKAEHPDLQRLWHERIVHLLRRPLLPPHPYTECIEAHYPWRTANPHRI